MNGCPTVRAQGVLLKKETYAHLIGSLPTGAGEVWMRVCASIQSHELPLSCVYSAAPSRTFDDVNAICAALFPRTLHHFLATRRCSSAAQGTGREQESVVLEAFTSCSIDQPVLFGDLDPNARVHQIAVRRGMLDVWCRSGGSGARFVLVPHLQT